MAYRFMPQLMDKIECVMISELAIESYMTGLQLYHMYYSMYNYVAVIAAAVGLCEHKVSNTQKDHFLANGHYSGYRELSSGYQLSSTNHRSFLWNWKPTKFFTGLLCMLYLVDRRQSSHTTAASWMCVLIAPRCCSGSPLPYRLTQENCASHIHQGSAVETSLVHCWVGMTL